MRVISLLILMDSTTFYCHTVTSQTHHGQRPPDSRQADQDNPNDFLAVTPSC